MSEKIGSIQNQEVEQQENTADVSDSWIRATLATNDLAYFLQIKDIFQTSAMTASEKKSALLNLDNESREMLGFKLSDRDYYYPPLLKSVEKKVDYHKVENSEEELNSRFNIHRILWHFDGGRYQTLPDYQYLNIYRSEETKIYEVIIRRTDETSSDFIDSEEERNTILKMDNKDEHPEFVWMVSEDELLVGIDNKESNELYIANYNLKDGSRRKMIRGLINGKAELFRPISETEIAVAEKDGVGIYELQPDGNYKMNDSSIYEYADGQVTEYQVLPDGKLLIADENGQIKLWDTKLSWTQVAKVPVDRSNQWRSGIGALLMVEDGRIFYSDDKGNAFVAEKDEDGEYHSTQIYEKEKDFEGINLIDVTEDGRVFLGTGTHTIILDGTPVES